VIIPKRHRILVIEPAGGLWGSERALLDLIDSAPQLEFAVCCPAGTPLVEELDRRGVKVLPFLIERLHQKPRWFRAVAALGILLACIISRPRTIHLNQSGVYRLCLPAARLLGLQMVCHVRIFEDAAYLAACRPRPAELKAIIAISCAIEDELCRFEALSAIPVARIYDAYVRDVGEATSLGARDPKIACVGRIVPIKGQDVLVQAMQQKDLLPTDVECLIAGDGLPRYVSELQAIGGDRARWLGFQSRPSALLAQCKILACPSHREPLGRVIFEAWSAGAIPVVYAGSGGAAEVVSASRGGIVYTEQTPRGLAEGLSTALSLPPQEAARMIANGRAWLDQHCAPRPYGEAVAKVLCGT
jgi:glycosyltransferase involved in cell wall biosynthesis